MGAVRGAALALCLWSLIAPSMCCPGGAPIARIVGMAMLRNSVSGPLTAPSSLPTGLAMDNTFCWKEGECILKWVVCCCRAQDPALAAASPTRLEAQAAPIHPHSQPHHPLCAGARYTQCAPR